MEDKLDEWTQELWKAGCCVSGFTLKVKALQILREFAQYNGTFSVTDGWLRGECGGTTDEEENDEEVDKRVSKKL